MAMAEGLTSSAPLRYRARAFSGASSLIAHTAPALSVHATLPLIRPIELKAWADVTPGLKTTSASSLLAAGARAACQPAAPTKRQAGGGGFGASGRRAAWPAGTTPHAVAQQQKQDTEHHEPRQVPEQGAGGIHPDVVNLHDPVKNNAVQHVPRAKADQRGGQQVAVRPVQRKILPRLVQQHAGPLPFRAPGGCGRRCSRRHGKAP